MKRWYSTDELSGVEGLPTSPQAINKKGHIEHWVQRKKTGVQGGKAIEYSIDSLPELTQATLSLRECTRLYLAAADSSLSLWLMLYENMDAKQRADMTSLVMRKGIEQTLVCLMDEADRAPHHQIVNK